MSHNRNRRQRNAARARKQTQQKQQAVDLAAEPQAWLPQPEMPPLHDATPEAEPIINYMEALLGWIEPHIENARLLVSSVDEQIMDIALQLALIQAVERLATHREPPAPA